MAVLNLGVLDLPYAAQVEISTAFVDDPKAFKEEFGIGDNVTTGDVATSLEHRYGVMEGFVRLHLNDIERNLTQSVNAALEARLAGAPASLDLYAEGLAEIEKIFKIDYLSGMEAEHAGLGPGSVPTKAALEGRSLRFKNKKGPRRPSFIDSGLYQSSFKAWVE